MKRKLVVCAILCLLCVGSVITGFYGIEKFQVHSIERYVERRVAELDKYMEKTGQYPIQIDAITNERLPSALKYRSDGHSFSFYYETSSSIMGGQMYTNKYRYWMVAD